MYRCCECGAYLDTPYEVHECEEAPKQKVRKTRYLSEDIPKHQVQDAAYKEALAWQEWDAK